MAVQLPTVSDRYGADDVERFYRNGAWREETVADLVDRQAVALGDALFATDSTTRLSYAELRDRSIRLAVGLRRSGIGRGDRVVVQLPNWTDFATVVAGISRCGAIVVPVMPIYRHDEVGYVLADSGAKAAIIAKEFGGFDYGVMYETLAGDAPELTAVYLARVTDGADGAKTLASLQVDGAIDELVAELGDPPSADDAHLIVYTSGTTSRPKGCVHTWNTLTFTARTMATGLGWSSDDVAFGPSPITHATGYMTSIIIPLFAGGKTHLVEAWDPVAAFDRILEHGCTTSVTATVFLQMLIEAYDPEHHDACSLRLWVAAGAPIPPQAIRSAAEAFPTLEVLSLYGRSENMVTSMCKTGDDPELSLTSDGAAPEGIEIRIVDEDGGDLPPGQPGDIAYRGPGHMLGYLGQPALTEEMFTASGFSQSGDLGVMNETGYVRVTGRTKDIIIRGGMNISAREIEELILGHPNVKDVALIATPDERLGERACACVVLDEGATMALADLVTYLRETHQLATQKLPEFLEVVAELPRTATGKVQKHLLFDMVRPTEVTI